MKKCIAILLFACLLLCGCDTAAPKAPQNVAKPPAAEPAAEYYTPYHADPSLRQFTADVTYRRDSYPLLGRLNNLYWGWAQGLYETITANPLTLSRLSAPNLGWIRMAFSTGNGERVDMSPKEYDLFFYLLSNRNIALSREKLICEVWGYDFYGDARTLDTHIKLLRRSLGRYSEYIVTLRGVGYRFEGV